MVRTCYANDGKAIRKSYERTLKGAKIREELLEVSDALAKVETFWRFASGPSGSECGIFALGVVVQRFAISRREPVGGSVNFWR